MAIENLILKIGKTDSHKDAPWTEDGAKIKWGFSAQSGQVNELSNYEKLQNLLSVAMEAGTDLENLEYVDVRWKEPLAKRISIR